MSQLICCYVWKALETQFILIFLLSFVKKSTVTVKPAVLQMTLQKISNNITVLSSNGVFFIAVWPDNQQSAHNSGFPN